MSKRIPIFLGIVLTILAVWVLITPAKNIRQLFERLDHLGYDLQLRTYVLTEHLRPSTPVAIIDIDNRSLKNEGRWPWPRKKLADLVTQLQKQGAAVIAFDMFFAENQINIAENLLSELQKKTKLDASFESILRKNAPFFNEDLLFAKSLSESQSILALGFLPTADIQNQLPLPLLTLTPLQEKQLDLYKANGYISNIPILQQAAKGSGFINIYPDGDGIIRRTPLLMEYQGKLYPALSLQAVLSFLGEGIELVTPHYGKTIELEGIKLGSKVIPTDAKGQVLIPFIGRSYTFPYFSATEVMHGHVAKDALLGKIVFVGTSATGAGDLKATAIQNPFPGVEIQATLANGILLNHFSYKPAWTYGADVFLTILFGLVAAFLFPYLGPRTLSLLMVLLPPGILFLNNWVWERTGLILSLLMPVLLVLFTALLNMIYGYLFETRRREQLKSMFGQYVPEKHIDEMLRTRSDYGLHGEDRDMSVLFADIRNFTTISEGMSAAELVDMLNTFFTPMTEVIFSNRGTIDKYVGDLIMAFWGAPLKDKNHARHAIQSALEMQAKLKELTATLRAHNWPEIKIGIGINSGIMSVGDMGSRFRRNYTVLGDAVNLASRIEGLTKYYGVNIIVTESTQKNQTRFVFRKLDRVKVKGKELGIEIYEVVCKQAELTSELSTELALFHQALDDYFQQQWDAALTLMTELQTQYPDKKIYQLYIDRINEFKAQPPQTTWDGMYVHVTK